MEEGSGEGAALGAEDGCAEGAPEARGEALALAVAPVREGRDDAAAGPVRAGSAGRAAGGGGAGRALRDTTDVGVAAGVAVAGSDAVVGGATAGSWVAESRGAATSSIAPTGRACSGVTPESAGGSGGQVSTCQVERPTTNAAAATTSAVPSCERFTGIRMIGSVADRDGFAPVSASVSHQGMSK